MRTLTEIFEILKHNFGDVVEFFPSAEKPDRIKVTPSEIAKVAFFLRDNEALLFDSLTLLSAVDDADGKKVATADGSFTYEGGSLSVVYHLESLSFRHKLILLVRTDRSNPVVESVTPVWNGANWHEREAFDMMGIKFLNHPNLIRILMPYDWYEGSHPLRKDYKNPEFYKGMKIN